MRPETNLLEVDDTTTGHRIKFGIERTAMNHIMDMLAGVYKNTPRAVLRELITNALDSHIASGNPDPVKVWVGRQSKHLSLPVLVIQDWGLGLDEHDAQTILSQYGASTKRGSNDAVGMLGIGAKSPLAYTDQFTMECVKDGNKIVLLIGRNEEGDGEITVLDNGATVAPNGVRVEVPVAPGTDFIGEADQLFRFWDRGTVLVNDDEPKPVWEWEDRLDVTDSITVVDAWEDTDYIVMGNVPYPVDLGIYSRSTYTYRGGEVNGKSVVVRVPIGAVSFTPSREELKDTQRTKDTIRSIRQEFQKAARTVVQREVDAATSHSEALKAFVRANENLPDSARMKPNAFTYQGDALPEWGDVFGANQLRSAGYKYSTGKRTPLLDQVPEAIWISGYTNEHFTGGQREKLKLFLEANAPTLTDPTQRPLYITSADKPQHSRWIPPAHVFEWETIKKWKIPGAATSGFSGTGKMIQGSYYAHLTQAEADKRGVSRQYQAAEVEADSLVDGEHLYWIHAPKDEGYDRHRSLVAYDPDALLIMLSANRVEKFKRDFPKAREFKTAMAELIAKRIADLTPDDRAAIAFEEDDIWLALYTERMKMADPDLVRTVSIAQHADKNEDRLSALTSDATLYKVSLSGDADPAVARAKKRYALLEHIYTNYSGRLDAPRDHIHTYINAAYDAADKETNNG